MKLLRQGAYTNEVTRLNDELGMSISSLVATHAECSASMTFKVDTFEIVDARWSIHRAPDMERRGEGVLEMLIGESAYIHDKNSIKIMPDYSRIEDYSLPPGGWTSTPVSEHKSNLIENITDKEEARAKKDDVSPEWLIIRELCLENIRGIYQAEGFLITERGFPDLISYEEHFGDKDGYCRPYNDGFRPTVVDWPLHVGSPQHYRTFNLYNKYKQFTILDMEDGTIHASGAFHDGFHEIFVMMEYGKEDGIIKKLEETTVRVPFKACWELDHLHDELYIGLNIKSFAKRDIGKISGGAMGCFHIVDIIADIADMAKDF